MGYHVKVLVRIVGESMALMGVGITAKERRTAARRIDLIVLHILGHISVVVIAAAALFCSLLYSRILSQTMSLPSFRKIPSRFVVP